MFGIYVDKHLYLYTLKRPQIFYHNVHTVELALPPPHTLSVPHTAARVAFLGPNGGGGRGDTPVPWIKASWWLSLPSLPVLLN